MFNYYEGDLDNIPNLDTIRRDPKQLRILAGLVYNRGFMSEQKDDFLDAVKA